MVNKDEKYDIILNELEKTIKIHSNGNVDFSFRIVGESNKTFPPIKHYFYNISRPFSNLHFNRGHIPLPPENNIPTIKNGENDTVEIIIPKHPLFERMDNNINAHVWYQQLKDFEKLSKEQNKPIDFSYNLTFKCEKHLERDSIRRWNCHFGEEILYKTKKLDYLFE